jgi:hypothetical protein
MTRKLEHRARTQNSAYASPESILKLNNSVPSLQTQRMVLFNSPSLSSLPLDVTLESQEFEGRVRAFLIGCISPTAVGPKQYAFSNCLEAIECIKDGYSMLPTEKAFRRTGEPTHIHSLRIFLRGIEEFSQTEPMQHSVFYTSLLARIFHDAKEDLRNLSITPRTMGSDNLHPDNSNVPREYILHFENSPRDYRLVLTPSEVRLLRLQINAVSVPKGVDKIDEGEIKTKKQIRHLLNVVKTINEEFGPLAAYLTLRIKIDDRIDNVSTYYHIENINTLMRLIKKLDETENHFGGVEEQALSYFQQYNARRSYDEFTGFQPAVESAIQLCKNLRSRGGYDELFAAQIEYSALRGSTFLIPNFM